MIVKNEDEWTAKMNDKTHCYIVVVGTGERIQDIYASAEVAAGTPPNKAAKEALLVESTAVWGSWRPVCTGSFVTFSLCFKRHTVACFEESALPPDESLNLVLDRAFSKAIKHCKKG